MKLVKKIKNELMNSLAFLVVGGVCLLCALFIVFGTKSENGFITLDGKDAVIEQYTEDFISDAQKAMNRIMNEDAPTDSALEAEYDKDEVGLGFHTTIEEILARRLPDGDTDGGKGWQCSKYTAYLATGKREYSTAHPDYGPVNGKDVAAWLVKNYGFKYIDIPVPGAIGSTGFNTKYGHTAMYVGDGYVNDANYQPLAVYTHPDTVANYVWVVPGDYEPEPEPTPEPEPAPTPTPTPVSNCSIWNVRQGDTMSGIMLSCKGYVDWLQMNEYADRWISRTTGQSVFYGWGHGYGYGLIAGDIIEFNN